MTAVYRAPMRSRDDRVPAGHAIVRALERGVCGIGGRLDPPPASFLDALLRTDAAYGERAARRLERFAAAPEGSYVWTRADDLFWLGALAGDWRYDSAPDASADDLVHIRSCVWGDSPIPHDLVPAPVHVAFARGGRNWQRIRDVDALPLTEDLWDSFAPA